MNGKPLIIHCPVKVSSLITDEIKKQMVDKKIKQKEAAKMLGISESRVSELLNGKRALNLNIAKRLRDCFGIPADFIPRQYLIQKPG